MTLDRVRQAPVKACTNGRVVFAKLGNDRLLALLDNEKTGTQPDQQRNTGNQTSANTSAFHIRLKTTIVATTSTTVVVIVVATETTRFFATKKTV